MILRGETIHHKSGAPVWPENQIRDIYIDIFALSLSLSLSVTLYLSIFILLYISI